MHFERLFTISTWLDFSKAPLPVGGRSRLVSWQGSAPNVTMDSCPYSTALKLPLLPLLLAPPKLQDFLMDVVLLLSPLLSNPPFSPLQGGFSFLWDLLQASKMVRPLSLDVLSSCPPLWIFLLPPQLLWLNFLGCPPPLSDLQVLMVFKAWFWSVISALYALTPRWPCPEPQFNISRKRTHDSLL